MIVLRLRLRPHRPPGLLAEVAHAAPRVPVAGGVVAAELKTLGVATPAETVVTDGTDAGGLVNGADVGVEVGAVSGIIVDFENPRGAFEG